MLKFRKRRRESVPLLCTETSNEKLHSGADKGEGVLKSTSSPCVPSCSGENKGTRRFSVENWGLNFIKKRRIRRSSTNQQSSPSSPALSCDTKEDPKLSNFISWCGRSGISISDKVVLSRKGSCANIGMVASAAIHTGERLAYIPKEMLLCAKNSYISEVMYKDVQFMEHLESASSWVPLLATLVYEWSKMKENGKWFPYLEIVPNTESLEPPMMWSKTERERLLSGTTLLSKVEADLGEIEHDYETIIKPFMQRHPDIFNKKLISFQFYQGLVSFVMAYSFTSGPPADCLEEGDQDILEMTSMVPVIDLLNHHYRHHAELNFRQDHLELIAVRDIEKGEEVMNTYGQHSGTSLLHMYGFALRGNPHDVGFLSSNVVVKAALDAVCGDSVRRIEMIKERWRKLKELERLKTQSGEESSSSGRFNPVGRLQQDSEVYSGEESFQISSKGIPEEDMLKLIQLLLGRKEYFEEEILMILSTEADSEEDTISNSSDDDLVINSKQEVIEERYSEEELDDDGDLGSVVELIGSLPGKSKKCIGRMIELQLTSYPESPRVTKQALHSKRTTPREKMAAIVCYGQQKCLLALLNHIQNAPST